MSLYPIGHAGTHPQYRNEPRQVPRELSFPAVTCFASRAFFLTLTQKNGIASRTATYLLALVGKAWREIHLRNRESSARNVKKRPYVNCVLGRRSAELQRNVKAGNSRFGKKVVIPHRRLNSILPKGRFLTSSFRYAHLRAQLPSTEAFLVRRN